MIRGLLAPAAARCAPFLAALFAVACSSSSSPGGSGNSSSGSSAYGVGADSGVVGCAGQGDTYVANLTKPGELGKYTFTLVQAMPAPPDLNENVWTVKVTDSSGAAPLLSQLVAYPFMPLMGHSSSQTPQLATNADGTFTVSNLYLFMPGLWTLTLSVTEPVSGDAGASAQPVTLDKAVYSFCVN